MRLQTLVVSILTLTPPKAPPLAPIEGPELEDLTVVAVPGVVDGRHSYVLRRNLAIAHGDLSFESVMHRVITGTAIKARMHRHFQQRTATLLAAHRRRAALIGPLAFFRRSAR